MQNQRPSGRVTALLYEDQQNRCRAAARTAPALASARPPKQEWQLNANATAMSAKASTSGARRLTRYQLGLVVGGAGDHDARRTDDHAAVLRIVTDR